MSYQKIFFDDSNNSMTGINCFDSNNEHYRENNPENFTIDRFKDGKRMHDFKPLENGKEICQEIKERYQELKETVIDASDWQTYRNEEFGFEVKYPKDFLAETKKLSVLQIFKNTKIESLYKVEFIDSEKSNNISIEVCNNGNNYSLDQWLKKYKETNPVGAGLSFGMSPDKEKEIIIDDVKGLKGDFGCCMTYQHSVFLKNGDRIYQIGGGYLNFKDRLYPNEEIFNQILSTFKFIEK